MNWIEFYNDLLGDSKAEERRARRLARATETTEDREFRIESRRRKRLARAKTDLYE